MLTKYTFWSKLSIFFLFITAALHSIALVSGLEGTNATEKTMLGLMNSYKMEMGLGFNPTMSDLMNSFSISFTLLLLFGGLILIVLLKTKAAVPVMKGILGMSTLIYGACFVAMLMLTFIVPVVCTGLIFISILTAYLLSLKAD